MSLPGTPWNTVPGGQRLEEREALGKAPERQEADRRPLAELPAPAVAATSAVTPVAELVLAAPAFP
jgi:hypothetical protein